MLTNRYGDKIKEDSFNEMEKTEIEEYLPPPSELDVALYKTMFNKLRWWRNFRYPFSPNKEWANLRFSNPKYQNWREKIIKKYDGKCVKCNLPATHCHHIINFSSNLELRHDPNNGVLFCKKCHFKFHKKFGTVNNTKLQLREFGVVL